MWNCLKEIAAIAPLGTLLVALAAVGVALKQWKTARQNEAKRQYSAFLLNSADSKIESSFVQGICPNKNDLPVLRKYKWYLASYLFAAEEILREFPQDDAWNRTIIGVLNLHRDGIMGVDENCYSNSLKKLILQVRASNVAVKT